MDIQLSLTAQEAETGEVLYQVELGPQDLVALTLPLRPAILNMQHYKNLTAKDWRHKETSWYDKEHEVLTQVRSRSPRYVDSLRVLLEAAFVKQAETMGNNQVLKVSRKRFEKEFEVFAKHWPLPSRSPAELLKIIDPSSYFLARSVPEERTPGTSGSD